MTQHAIKQRKWLTYALPAKSINGATIRALSNNLPAMISFYMRFKLLTAANYLPHRL
jgi:hypothetical protein